jgi:uncharacterized protein (TIGR03437 family)
LAGVKVLVNGVAAPIQSVSPTQVTFEWQAPGGGVSVQVSAAGGQSNSLQVPLVPSTRHQFRGLALHKDFSPVTSAAPARVGESLLVFAIASEKDVTVSIAGRAATVESVTPAGNFQGLAVVQVKVPAGIPPSRAGAVGIATSSSFTDVLEIPLAQ